MWIPVIPGADGALALAMLKLIIEQERYDKGFVSEYTRGFEEFRKYVGSLELNDLSRFCGVSVEHKGIDRCVLFYGKDFSDCIYWIRISAEWNSE